MLILANTLSFNGGTTFILRLCREFLRRDKRIGVLVLINDVDKKLLLEIEKYADVYFLGDYQRPLFSWTFSSQLGVFFPLDFKSLKVLFHRYDNCVHVMGVFGLLFAARFIKKQSTSLKMSVGIYHQNEFMFSDANYYFANIAKAIFSKLGADAVILFNENCVTSYSVFFDNDYSSSVLVPVGIDLPVMTREIYGDSSSGRIVSIGNLYNFKSYNMHIINCMPFFLMGNPSIVYEIYGAGPFEKNLKELVASLGIEHAVFFKGQIPYSELPDVLAGAFLFVGSGTAIVEASALGIPSLIGIESTREPITYGFLSDVEGFSYNEMIEGKKVSLMLDTIKTLLHDSDAWLDVAIKCKGKASSFSVIHTVDGFQLQGSRDFCVGPSEVNGYSNIRALISFLCCGVKHTLGVDVRFANRRDQGTLG
ncbi:glycosyltransferase [Pseudomonas paeninsulae]|uniref:glycosyltransferase n=1 Tax=Pseudomonas paeninsulae TaxID=3110772 RepID=UPI002D7759F2|nr:glycosyltransferase [Pseudomonas sp. IT1137]